MTYVPYMQYNLPIILAKVPGYSFISERVYDRLMMEPIFLPPWCICECTSSQAAASGAIKLNHTEIPFAASFTARTWKLICAALEVLQPLQVRSYYIMDWRKYVHIWNMFSENNA